MINPLRAVLALAMLFSGASLLATLYLRTPLAFTLLAFFAFALVAGTLSWIGLSPSQRFFVKGRLKWGFIAGITATIAYDLTRFTLAELWGNGNFRPFETWRIFGKLIGGSAVTPTTAFIVGMLYHAINGITFSCAFFIFVGKRTVLKGVLWALVLEALMFTVYPGWLDLQAVLIEFTVVSLTGHVVYGLVIGNPRRWHRS